MAMVFAVRMNQILVEILFAKMVAFAMRFKIVPIVIAQPDGVECIVR